LANTRFWNLFRAKAIETAATPEERAWFEADRWLREKITLHDMSLR
jgi:hypothetical protein